jgi:DNA-binding MarR family transcriptional regulator
MIDDNNPESLVERAMVAIRRSQSRRTLARLAGQPPDAGAGGSAFDVLDAIEAAEQAGSPAGVGGVAAALGVDQPRASRLVAAAVGAGLVRREADQADGRRSVLVRTAAGRAASEEVRRFRRSVFASAMADWSDAERAEFARLLTRFVGGLGRVSGTRARPEP